MTVQDSSVVNSNGSEDTTTTAPTTVTNTDSDTSNGDAANHVEPNTSTIIDDSDFDDIDKANPLKPEDIANGDLEDSEEDNETDTAAIDSDKGKNTEADGVKKPEASSETDTTVTDADKPTGKQSRMSQLQEEIDGLKQNLGIGQNTDVRALVAERNSLRELQAANIRKAGIDLERKLLDEVDPDTGEPYTPETANRMARAATIEAEQEAASQEKYTLEVEHNQRTIQQDTERAIASFTGTNGNSIFQEKLADGSDNPDYDEIAAELAGQHLMDAFVFEDTGKKDADGKPITQLVNIRRSPYEIMKSVADATQKYKSTNEAEHKAALAAAEARAATNIAKQANGADIPTSGNTATTKANNSGDDFDEEWDNADS